MQCVTFGQHLHLNGSVVQQDAAASSDRALQLLVRDPDAVGGLVGAHRGVIGQSNLGMKKTPKNRGSGTRHRNMQKKY